MSKVGNSSGYASPAGRYCTDLAAHVLGLAGSQWKTVVFGHLLLVRDPPMHQLVVVCVEIEHFIFK
jgi:hypothetical protein